MTANSSIAQAQSRFASAQEELVHKLSSHVFGAQALFCPENYGHSKEPADVAWISNRCAIIINMTEGRSKFEKKVKHNNAQLHRWLRKWRSGQILSGTTGSIRHSFQFGDVDHVIGLSVVNDENGWCQYHPGDVYYSSSYKLSGCATVTNSVIEELARMGACARDFLYLLKELSLVDGPVPSKKAIEAVRTRFAIATLAVQQEFRGIHRDTAFLVHLFRQGNLALNLIRMNTDVSSIVSSICADLRLEDILWIAAALAALETHIAKPQETGILALAARRHSDGYLLQCFACANMEVAAGNYGKVQSRNPGITITASFDSGRDTPIVVVAVQPRNGPSVLEREALSLRQATTGC